MVGGLVLPPGVSYGLLAHLWPEAVEVVERTTAKMMAKPAMWSTRMVVDILS